MDGHMGLANSVALMLAGISNITDDPKGGTVMRTATGGNNLLSYVSRMGWISKEHKAINSTLLQLIKDYSKNFVIFLHIPFLWLTTLHFGLMNLKIKKH